MKKLFTLAAAGAMAAAAFSAQAQVTLDGQLTAAEVTAGNYVLIGKYTNARGFGDAGLLSLYAASTATKFYIFVGGTVEPNGNAFQLFLDLPGVAGVPVGTSLPAGPTTTSFQNMTSKLDLAADLALALRSDGTVGYQIEGVAYTSATAASVAKLTTTTAPVLNTGAPLTLASTATTGNYARLTNARISYKVMAPGGLAVNPGNTTPNTGASYGGVGSYGWEIELDRTSAGLTGTPQVSMFVVQNSGDGGYISTDYIPQTSSPIPPAGTNPGNPGTGAYDFTAVVGRQAATVALNATGVALGTKAADAAAVGLAVFPNPAAGQATIAYNVSAHSENVNIVLTDLLGRPVQVLENSVQAVGLQSKTVSTASVAAGTYLVRVQVGDKVATRKVVLL